MTGNSPGFTRKDNLKPLSENKAFIHSVGLLFQIAEMLLDKHSETCIFGAFNKSGKSLWQAGI